jgi:hypothetical protein
MVNDCSAVFDHPITRSRFLHVSSVKQFAFIAARSQELAAGSK